MNIDKRTSGGFMSANLIATIFVVAIHYGSKGNIQPTAIGGWNYLFQEFSLNGIARIAVPFFSLISGYFMAQKLSEETKYIAIIHKKCWTLLFPYLVASLFIFLSSTGFKYLFQHESYQPFTISLLIKSVIFRPLSIQFWFLRDLMILTLLAPLFACLKQTYYALFMFLLAFLWLVDYQPFPIVFGWYLLNINTLFFFVMGGALFYRTSLLDSVLNASMLNKIIVFSLWLFLIAIRVYIDPTLDVWYVSKYSVSSVILYKTAIFLGVCSLLQLSMHIYSNKHVIYWSGLVFFVYLFHLVPLSYFRIVTRKIVPEEYLFYINFPIALFAVFLIAHLWAKYLPKSFSLITGGRNPNKALKRIQ